MLPRIPCSRLFFLSFLTTILITSAVLYLLSPIPGLTSPRTPSELAAPPRPKACFVILARNEELFSLLPSIRSLEDRFNSGPGGGYDYVFLNDKEFHTDFKRRTSALISTNAKYGLVPVEHWVQPDWIDEEKATKAREEMKAKGVLYGDSVSYRNMCRFQSGFFYRHPLLEEYDYYWRVEPGTNFPCDLDAIDQDPFRHMVEKNISYGWTISLVEYAETIPTLWDAVKEFMKLYPQYIAEDNAMRFISDDEGETYNGCHFWSNFEIANLNLWRSPAYQAFFEFLDSKGGFYLERWGDAPVHSIAACLLLPKDQIEFLEPIGYYHIPMTHCPAHDKNMHRCHCDPYSSVDLHRMSCLRKWPRVAGAKKWVLPGL